MGTIMRRTGAAALVALLGALLSRLGARWKPELKRRRVPRNELYAAYERASRDPAYMAELDELERAFDSTTADGLEETARTR
jgi:hypothetical protein